MDLTLLKFSNTDSWCNCLSHERITLAYFGGLLAVSCSICGVFRWSRTLEETEAEQPAFCFHGWVLVLWNDEWEACLHFCAAIICLDNRNSRRITWEKINKLFQYNDWRLCVAATINQKTSPTECTVSVSHYLVKQCVWLHWPLRHC